VDVDVAIDQHTRSGRHGRRSAGPRGRPHQARDGPQIR
jgi:hypothetical protein